MSWIATWIIIKKMKAQQQLIRELNQKVMIDIGKIAINSKKAF
jgi:hypothetical protein